MRGWTLLLGVAVVVVCNFGSFVTAVDGTSVLEHGWEAAMMEEKLAPLMKHAKEAIRDKVNEWLQERREQRAARERHKAKLFAQRKMASSPEPSSIWMSLMSDVLANMTPSEITFPGTHDSGTYNLDYDISGAMPTWAVNLITFLSSIGIKEPLDVIKEWSVTQTYSIYDQLYYGNRYIDLRVTYDASKSEFRTLHMLMGDPFQILLNDIARFMNESQGEIVVLQFGDFTGFTPLLHQVFLSNVTSLLGKYLYPRNQPFTTFAKMVASGQRIVAFYDSSDAVANNNLFWLDNDLPNNWANVDNYNAMLPVEVASVQTQSGVPNGVYKLQWILTTSADRIIAALIEGSSIKSLHDLGRTANVNFDFFVQKMQNYRINLLMVDFFEETDNMERSRMANRQQCNDAPQFRALTTNKQDCRSWAAAGLCINATVQHYCPLSCWLCKQVAGEPGASCSQNSQCIYQQCNTKVGICLTDMPRSPQQPCGAGYQCFSGVCNNFACTT